jgi:hypothetical protein
MELRETSNKVEKNNGGKILLARSIAYGFMLNVTLSLWFLVIDLHIKKPLSTKKTMTDAWATSPNKPVRPWYAGARNICWACAIKTMIADSPRKVSS